MDSNQPACNNCESPLISSLFCFSCNAIQPYSSTNFFEVFGFQISFDVKPEELEERYQELFFGLHPDFFVSASSEEKLLSEGAAAILNNAYNTLKDQTSRADYLLKLLFERQNLDVRSLPDGFLAEMFFLQEELDNLINSKDLIKLSKMNENIQKRKTNIEAEYFVLFRKYEENPEDTTIPQQLQTNLNAERYLKRLLERIPTSE